MTSQLFDPKELIRIAEFLAERDSSEASFRTAVNRTYYAALLASRQFLGVTGSRHIHSRVIGELRRYDQSAGTQLRRLESSALSQTTTLKFRTRSEETGAGTINSLAASLNPYSEGSNESSTQCV